MRRVILGFLLLGTAISSFAQTQQVLASKTSPIANPPLFIVLGSDDNTNADAIRWMQSVIDGKNADGVTQRYMSFYVNTDQTGAVWNRNGDLVEAAYAAYKAGHEIGNHTSTHIAFVDFDKAATVKGLDTTRYEIERVRTILENAGIPKQHQFGFRTPFLRYSKYTFEVLNEMGFLYDCSINATDTTNKEIGMYNFPYTINEDDGNGNFARDNWEKFNEWGARAEQKIGTTNSLWELACMRFAIDPSDIQNVAPKLKAKQKEIAMEEQGAEFDEAKWEAEYKFDGYITGLDYNMWWEAQLNEDETVRSWLQTVKESYESNRAPVTIGIHSQYYFDGNEATYPNMGTPAKKQSAFERFVAEASKLPDVFFVSGDMVIRWMKDPCSASDFAANIEKYRRPAYNGPAAAPSKIRLSNNSINEGSVGLEVGTLRAVDLNVANTHTFAIKEGNNGDLFEISGNALKFKTPQPNGEYIVNISASNSTGESPVSKFYIYVDKKYTTDIEFIGTETVKGNWSGDPDGIGSKVTDINQVPLKATLYLAPHKIMPDGSTSWPYVSIGKKYTTGFRMTGLQKIIVNYNSDKDVSLSIGAWSTKVGFGFAATLPKTSKDSTAEITPDMFTVTYTEGDENAIPGSFTDALGFAGNTVSFAGIEENSTTNITVNSLRFIGIPNEKTPEKVAISKTAVNKQRAISLTGINAKQLNLSVAKAGVYSVDIFSVNGKRLFTSKNNMSAGINRISMPKNLAKGIAVIRVSGLNTKVEQKMLIK